MIGSSIYFHQNPAAIPLGGASFVVYSKKNIESAASFESYTMFWTYVTILSMTPFLLQYVTLTLLYWDKNTIDLKEPQKHDFTSPKSSQLKSRIAHPQVVLRVFSIRTFVKMTWQECLGSKMNQIWFQLIWLILIDFQYGTKHQKKW